MAKVSVFGSVRFQTEAALQPREPDDWVLGILGKITGTIEIDGETLPDEPISDVGRIRAYLMQTMKAHVANKSLSDVADAHSDYLLEAYNAVYDPSGYEPKDELEVGASCEGMLLIDRVKIREDCRKSNVMVQAIEELIRVFGNNSVIVAHQNRLKLNVLQWKQLGFKKIAGTPFFYRDDYFANPYGMSVPKDD